jgi:hypothetical protein
LRISYKGENEMSKITTNCSVKIEPRIEDLHGNIIRTCPTQYNLITDAGLNMIAAGTYGLGAVTRYLHFGTAGTPTPVNRPAGVITMSQTGTTVTASAPFFEVGDANVKRVMQLSNNTTCRIIAFTSSTEVTVDTTASYTGLNAIIWNVDQPKLTQWSGVTGSLYNLGLETNHGTSRSAISDDSGDNVLISRWRTLYFDSTSTRTITELGWSPVSTTNTDMFGKIILDSPIFVDVNERFIVKITLYQKFWTGVIPNGPIFNAEVTWSTAHLLTVDLAYFNRIDSAGAEANTNSGYTSYCADPKLDQLGIRFTNSAGQTVLSALSASAQYYTQPYGRRWSPTYTVMTNSMDELKSISLGNVSGSTFYSSGPIITWTTPQDKNNNIKMAMTIRIYWDRSLPAFPS